MEISQEDSKILRIAGDVGFDFMNTNYKWVDRIEVFDTPDSLLYWFVDSKLMSEKDVTRIQKHFSEKDLNRLLEDALELRERLREFATEFKEKGSKAFSKDSIQYFNEILRLGHVPERIEIADKNHFHLRPAHEWKNVEEILAIIVQSVMTTLSTEDFDLIKRCENPKCPIWFVDRTKAHRRKFCSQAICGNRAKQAAFRERNQSDD